MSSSQSTSDVQVDLQAYLTKHSINDLFVEIVEQLLFDKPENPVGYMVEYLIKNHPDEICKLSKASSSELSKLAIRKDSNMVTPADFVRTSVSDNETESESEDVYDDALVPNIPTPTAIKGGLRRTSVCAELVDPNAVQPVLSKYPKSPEETTHILQMLGENLMFKHLDHTQTNKVCEAMFSITKQRGDIIIKEGEDGDNFYIIDEGSIDVYINKDYQEVKVKSMGRGESFGELALMYSTPRSATCKAATEVRLWALDRMSFKVILMLTTIYRRNQYKSFLSNVPILHELTEYEVLTLADSLVEEIVEDATVVCQQGEVGEAFYIIKQGVVVCSQTDSTGETVEVARLNKGHYFGELALMTSKARQATVTSVGQTSLLKLDRKTFQRILGRMEDILMRNMESYRKIQAQNI